MIYFVQNPAGGPIKIGFTDDLATRLPQLEAKYRQPLAVLATMPGGRAEEGDVHARFAHLRLGKTEQFKPADDLLVFIGCPILVGANPDAVEAMEDRTKPLVVQIRGSEAYKAWVEDVAEREGESIAGLFVRAVRQFAKELGYPASPKR